MKDEKTAVRRHHDVSDTPLRHRRRDGEVTVDRARRQKVRYTGPCGYYICYSIFVAIVGLTLLAVILTVHLARCVLAASEMMSVYECFVDLRLGPVRRPSTRRLTI